MQLLSVFLRRHLETVSLENPKELSPDDPSRLVSFDRL